MNLTDVAAELAEQLDTIAGLRCFSYRPDTIHPPTGFVDLPERIEYDQTYGRGLDSMTLHVFVVVAQVGDRSRHAEIRPYMDGSGTKSVKAALDSSSTSTYTSCHDVTVSTVEPVYILIGETPYLAADFTVAVMGAGSPS